MRVLLFLIVGLIGFAPSTWAADLSEVDSDTCQTRLTGQIVKGDAEKLWIWYQSRNVSPGSVHGEALCLDGPGGALAEALDMGQMLYDLGIRSRLEAGASCLSACAVLFMMGTEYMDHGSGDGHNADRRMHVTARLGFHRPELRLPPGGTVDTAQLSRAYDLAIVTVLEYVRLANLGSHRETMIPSDLIEVMMERRGEDYYFIDTTGKAGRWKIGLDGAQMPTAMDRTAALAACNNLAVWQLRYSDDYGSYDPMVQVDAVTRTADSVTYAVFGDLGAIDRHHECLLRFRDQGEGSFVLDACGFMDAQDVIVGGKRCESIAQADPELDVWSTDLAPLGDDARMALLPPDTQLIDAEGVARKVDERARRALGTNEEVGVLAFRTRCSAQIMSAEVRGVQNFTNLRATPGLGGDVIGTVALGARVQPVANSGLGFATAPDSPENCRTWCGWMTPGPGGLKSLYSQGGDFDFVNQCLDDNHIWYHVETGSGQSGYLSGKFLRY